MKKLIAALSMVLAASGLAFAQGDARVPTVAELASARHKLVQLQRQIWKTKARPSPDCPRPRPCEPGYLQTVLDVPGGWCEGVAVDRFGNVYTSDQVTQIVYRVTPHGSVSEFARLFLMDNPDAQYAGTLGLEFDRHGDLWIAALNYLETDKHGIYRITPDGKSVLAVPMDPAQIPGPDGLEFDPHGDLYIAEVMNGGIWKVAQAQSTATLWLTHDLLVPPAGGVFGANGIIYKDQVFYVTNTDKGTIVKVPVNHDGSPGEPTVFVSGLNGPDGIILGHHDDFYVTCSYGGQLVRVTMEGAVEVVLDQGLGYPTTPAFGTTEGEKWTLYLANFLSWMNGVPSLQKVRLCPGEKEGHE